MKQAKEKVWRTAEGKLVKDGHESATILVAAEGQLVPDEYVDGFDNAGTFFKDINPKHPEPPVPSPRMDDFKPGQSNSPAVKGLPKDRVGPVKDLGGNATVTGKVGDYEAMIGTIPSKPDQKTQPAKATKATKKTKAKK